jgi:hypothetical protein
MTTERPNLSILQSLNQESFNQRITQSTNQPIKKASARRSNENSRESLQVSPQPGEGRATQTQTTRGGGLKASASGIAGFR